MKQKKRCGGGGSSCSVKMILESANKQTKKKNRFYFPRKQAPLKLCALEKTNKRKKKKKNPTWSHRVRLTLWTTPALHRAAFVCRVGHTWLCDAWDFLKQLGEKKKKKRHQKSSTEWILRIFASPWSPPPPLVWAGDWLRKDASEQVQGWEGVGEGAAKRTEGGWEGCS